MPIKTPLEGCIAERPGPMPGTLKLVEAPDVERLMLHPGVNELKSKSLGFEGVVLPNSLWELGTRPGRLRGYQPEAHESTPSGLKLHRYQLRGVRFLREVTPDREGAILAADPGTGKQQPVDTLVSTPRGWRKIGDLVVGDSIHGSDGKAYCVSGVYPQGIKSSYRVIFSDGSSVEAGPEHLWTILYRKKRSIPYVWGSLTLTTEQLRDRGNFSYINLNGQKFTLQLSKTKLYLPMLSAPLSYNNTPATQFQIHPYLLGQLLANGSTAHGTPCLISSTESWPEILSNIEKVGTGPSSVRTYGSAVHASFSGLTKIIRALGIDVISGQKRIPRCYMEAGPEARVDLFHGLMDGDGSISATRNRLGYCTTSYGLAQDVQELVEGLGGIASIRTYDRSKEDKGIEYIVRIRLPEWILPFTISKRASRYNPGKNARPARLVESVEYVRDVESVCISVDSPDQLYVTEHSILTHNTLISLHSLWLDGCLQEPGIVIGPNLAKPTWCDEDSDARRHYGLEIRALSGVKFADPKILQTWPWFFCHFEILHAWQAWIIYALQPKWMICDESHFLANQKAQCSAAARELSKAVCIKRRFVLTGTPIPNSRLELWAQLAVAQPRQWDSNRHKFGVRFCLSAGTQITMGDFTERPIEQLRVGDVILGYASKGPHRWWELRRASVTAIHHHEAELWALHLADGTKLYTTQDHHWLDGNGADYRSIRKGRDQTRRLYRLHSGLRASDTGTQVPMEYIDGWLRGMLDGDGHVRKSKVSPYIAARWGGDFTFSVTITQAVPKNAPVLARVEAYARLKGWRATRRSRDNGAAEIISLSVFRGAGGGVGNTSARGCYEFATSPWPVESDSDFWRGWLAGMYDAEGSGRVITQSESAIFEKYALLGRILRVLKFDAMPIYEERKNCNVGWRIRGGRQAMLRFRDICDPCSLAKLDCVLMGSLETTRVGILSFEPTGIFTRVFNIATETGNYFAAGLASKNCSGALLPVEEGGFWSYDGESNTQELCARLAGTFLRFTKYEAEDSHIPTLKRHVIEAKIGDPRLLNEYSLAQTDVKSFLRQQRSGAGLPTKVKIGHKEVDTIKASGANAALTCFSSLISILSKIKKDPALKETIALLTKHKRIVVFTWHAELAKWLYKKLNGMLPVIHQVTGKTPQIYGPADRDMPIEKRKELASAFAVSPCAVYVATLASVGTSINALSAADAGFMTELSWNTVRLIQGENRIQREGCPWSEVHMYYLICRNTIDDVFLKTLQDKVEVIGQISPQDVDGDYLVRDLSPSYSDSEQSDKRLASIISDELLDKEWS